METDDQVNVTGILFINDVKITKTHEAAVEKMDSFMSWSKDGS
jgi:hypothetical protein